MRPVSVLISTPAAPNPSGSPGRDLVAAQQHCAVTRNGARLRPGRRHRRRSPRPPRLRRPPRVELVSSFPLSSWFPSTCSTSGGGERFMGRSRPIDSGHERADHPPATTPSSSSTRSARGAGSRRGGSSTCRASGSSSVRWRFISLYLINVDKDSEYAVSHRPGAPRHVQAAARAPRGCLREGNDAVGRLYTAMGTELHVHRRRDEAYADVPSFARRMSRRRGSRPGVRRPRRRRVPRRRAPRGDRPRPRAHRRQRRDADHHDRAGHRGAAQLLRAGDAQGAQGRRRRRLWNAVATLAHSDVAELKRTLRGELVFD